MQRKSLRAIPSVDKVLRELTDIDLPRAAVVAVVRRELGEVRAARKPLDADAVMRQIRESLSNLARAKIQPVINGTGILIHTNLGRCPLGEEVVQTLSQIASNYNNLEYDLIGGKRSGRAAYLEHNLAVLCGAQAATVVNNNAAALVLILHRFVSDNRREVVISRGELIQIGGGFRIPEILQASGAILREIGTTNKTSIADYSRAINKQTALILKVHRSNFFMSGFVESADTAQIAALTKAKRIPFVEDLGSGATVQTERVEGLEHEPTPAEVLRQGVDLVCFSGDKLMGGPQAGIIAGKAKMIAALKREPFFRALRCDKLILAALQATVDLHLRGQEKNSSFHESGIPALEMLSIAEDQLTARGHAIAARCADLPATLALAEGNVQIGGGTLPQSTLRSIVLTIVPRAIALEEFAARLRNATPGIIGYVSGGKFKLDLRTIFPRQDAAVANALRDALAPDSP